ncbi:MAG: dUTP diphosphatase [Proteobacteria bacterium]|nr:dUTP diphosphatase [Pseudomonadota bacterium]
MIELKYKRFVPDAVVPEFKTSGSVGADLSASERVVVKAKQATLVSLGIGFDIPDGHMIMLSLRSSTPKRKGIFIPNGVGIIDSDYKGELKLLVSPLGDEDVIIEKHERIAQAVLVPSRGVYSASEYICSCTEVDGIGTSVRDNGCFGSTG